jgi:hypothetical protein
VIRRRLLIAAALAAGGCAELAGPRTLRIDEAELAERIRRRFPVERSLLAFVDLTLADPRVTLLPQDNRIAAAVALRVVERQGARRLDGSLALDFGLRLEAADGTLRLDRPRVREVELQRQATSPLRRALTDQLLRDAASVAERLLDGFVVYTVPAQRLQALRSAGYQPGELRVVPGAVELTLVPLAASAPSR